ncbi:MAG: acyltransferase [Kiritimatiellae bacterium]|jgi:acetyltransferase-like isoleucine patch superfamily enzyme|nr:acyltransferase [Kiritimatiellia bacterium]
MNSAVQKIIGAFIFSSAGRKAWRMRAKIAKLSKTNGIDICRADLSRIKLKISGSGNNIRVHPMLKTKGTLNITIIGSGCSVEIGPGLSIEHSLKIFLGNSHYDLGPVSDVHVSIGKNTGFNGNAVIMAYNSHSRIEIGDECLFGADVTMYQTDGHPIYDLKTGRITNRADTMHIGNHVWTGSRSTYLKNSFVADGSIVGFGSVVTRRFTDSNVVISGNPASCVRTGVSWKSGDPDYIANVRENRQETRP